MKVITFGVFDFFHLGHLRVFEQCKQHGDYLIVAVQDGDFVLKYKPDAKIMYSTQERVDMVSALRIVDEVMIYKNFDKDFLSEIEFDILALGEDHTAERFTQAAQWCEAVGKRVVRLKRTPGISSSDLKKKEK